VKIVRAAEAPRARTGDRTRFFQTSKCYFSAAHYVVFASGHQGTITTSGQNDLLWAFERKDHSLKKSEHEAKCRELERYYEDVLKQASKRDKERPRVIRDDREVLSTGLAKAEKAVYLFLRSLRIADAIRFPNENMVGTRSFEEVAGKAIDSDHRTLARVGYAGEQSGPAHIDFGKDWQSGIVPFLKSAVAIISMPSVTPSCLEESYLIRNTKELLAKTLFVLPPLCCYQKQTDRPYQLGEDFVTFQHKMVAFHREVFGLQFPDPMVREGCFDHGWLLDLAVYSVIEVSPDEL
jgi:hypothetical protein